MLIISITDVYIRYSLILYIFISPIVSADNAGDMLFNGLTSIYMWLVVISLLMLIEYFY